MALVGRKNSNCFVITAWHKLLTRRRIVNIKHYNHNKYTSIHGRSQSSVHNDEFMHYVNLHTSKQWYFSFIIIIIINDIYRAQIPKSIKCATSTGQQTMQQVCLQAPRRLVKTSRDMSSECSSASKLFQTEGPLTASFNQRSLCTTNSKLTGYGRPIKTRYWYRDAARYNVARPCKHLHTWISVLYRMLCRTSSQCKLCNNTGIMCSALLAPVMNQEPALWIQQQMLFSTSWNNGAWYPPSAVFGEWRNEENNGWFLCLYPVLSIFFSALTVLVEWLARRCCNKTCAS